MFEVEIKSVQNDPSLETGFQKLTTRFSPCQDPNRNLEQLSLKTKAHTK
jgi:hypothetical protein